MLREVTLTKAMGFDGCHPRIVNKCSAALAIPITLIFKITVANGTVLDMWKRSNVTHFFTKGRKHKRVN